VTGAPTLAVVVSTIGRAGSFRRLVSSLEDGEDRDDLELIVVDQSDDGRCRRVLSEGSWSLRWQASTSARGASRGRNAGMRLTGAPLVVFPDDDAWYPPDTLRRVRAAFATDPGLAGLCGRQLTSDGRSSMLRWQQEPGPVTRWNFLRTSIMSTMFFRRSWLDRVGEFDEGMGVGSPGWYGACEESDLLLRVVEAGGRIHYDPSLVVLQEEPRDDPDEAFVAKMLSYGCGQGRLWRKRRLPAPLLAWYLSRKLGAAAVRGARGQRVVARADLAWIRGNVAGLIDRPPRELASRARAA
jgi:cellulose synthase/poly-beta-1,6-N-acetylglucosamine synthase-like glycosyltransferase